MIDNTPLLPDDAAVDAGVTKAMDSLSKVFDACIIMGTFIREDGKTCIIEKAFGNEYAIIGMVSDYIKKEDSVLVAEAVVDEMDARDAEVDES